MEGRKGYTDVHFNFNNLLGVLNAAGALQVASAYVAVEVGLFVRAHRKKVQSWQAGLKNPEAKLVASTGLNLAGTALSAAGDSLKASVTKINPGLGQVASAAIDAAEGKSGPAA
jgi:hypothetical protein